MDNVGKWQEPDNLKTRILSKFASSQRVQLTRCPRQSHGSLTHTLIGCPLTSLGSDEESQITKNQSRKHNFVTFAADNASYDQDKAVRWKTNSHQMLRYRHLSLSTVKHFKWE